MNPKAFSLYHYKQDRTYFLGILRDGFWPRYCAEDFTWMAEKPCYLMIPMVSFCDIPLELSREHREAYGDYVIGMNKEWGKTKDLNPLLYVNEDGPVAANFRTHKRHLFRDKLVKSDFPEVCWKLLPYLKPYLGAFPGGKIGTRHYSELKYFDQEMEWRFVPEEFRDEIFTESLWNDASDLRKIQHSETTRVCKLNFACDEVEILVVPSDSDRGALIAEFPAYSGRIKLWSEIGSL